MKPQSRQPNLLRNRQKMNPNNIFKACLLFAGALLLTSPSLAAQPVEDFPIVKLQSLDKTTARTMTFEARVGSTVKFGPLFIKVQACRKTSPIEQPESAAFLQVWELTTEEKPQWVFSGWMFASSPGLSSMDHPIYDVWVLDCLETKKARDEAAEAEKLGVKNEDGELNDAPAMPQEPTAAPIEETAPEDSEAQGE